MTKEHVPIGQSRVSRTKDTSEALASQEHQKSRTSMNLHMISESTGEALVKIAETVRAQYETATDHLHSMVCSQRQLRRVLDVVEASPGIVIHDLSDPELVEDLKQFCQRINVPCVAAARPAVSDNAKSSRWRGAIWPLSLVALALFLVWEIVTESLTAYLADGQPEVAIQWRSSNPRALLNLAQIELNKHPIGPNASAAASIDAESRARIRSFAEQVLHKDPLNAHAFRILGQLSQGDAEPKQTEKLMQAAARRSLNETYAVYWMMIKRYEDMDYHAAIRYADTLLRTRADHRLIESAVSVLAKIAENEGPNGEVAQLLASNPPWRPRFFEYLTRSISDARTPAAILLALKNTSAPPNAEERSRYLEFLVGRGFYDLAYYTWLQFLPAKQLGTLGHLYNGNFETPPSGAPFDWKFTETPGVTIGFRARPEIEGGGEALFIKFGIGRVKFGGVSQLLVMPPGSYEFLGLQKSDLLSKAGLRWQVICAGTPNKKIGEGPFFKDTDQRWQPFAFSLDVPETDCSAQYVRFVSEARSASEQFISGSVSFDELEMVRKPAVSQ